MNKKILIIIILIILLGVGIGAFCLIKFNNANEHSSVIEKSKNGLGTMDTNNYKIENISDGYAWVNDTYDHYTLIDTTGKVVYELPKEYTPYPVQEGYFWADIKSVYNSNENPTYKLISVNGDTVLESSGDYEKEELLNYGIIKNNSTYEWGVRTRQDIKDINGTTKKFKYYALKSNELVDYTDKIEETKEYSFEVLQNNKDINKTTRMDFGIYDSKQNKLKTYVLNHNDLFTIMQNDQEKFNPVSGKAEAIDSEDGSYRFIALVDGKHYIFNEDGSKEEITSIDNGYIVQYFYKDVIVVTKAASQSMPDLTNIMINLNTGKQVDINKK